MVTALYFICIDSIMRVLNMTYNAVNLSGSKNMINQKPEDNQIIFRLSCIKKACQIAAAIDSAISFSLSGLSFNLGLLKSMS